MIRFIPKRGIEFGIQNATKDISIALSKNLYFHSIIFERILKKLERLSP